MSFLKKIDIYYVITLIFLLITSNANFLSVNNICWFAALASMLTIAIIKKRLNAKDIKAISIFSIIYLLLVSVRDIFINDLDLDFLTSDVIFLFKYIFFAFAYVTLLKKETTAYLVKVMTHLTVISLVLFFLQITGFADQIYQFSNSLNLPASYDTPGYTNFLIFTYYKGGQEYRNSGFAWEPGAFGCFLCITLLLHFFNNGFKFDKKSTILLAGIITTFSTTTYLAALVILFLSYRFRHPKINKWVFALIPLAAILLFTVPFLGDKIGETYNGDMKNLDHLRSLQAYYHKRHQAIPLNRFGSMVYICQTFGSKLLLGVSNKFDMIMNKYIDVDISNGIADFFAKFGIAGFIFLIYRYSKFCLIYIRNKEQLVYCILVFLSLGFGEPLVQLPIVLIFLFLYAVYTDNTGEKKLPKKGIPRYERINI